MIVHGAVYTRIDTYLSASSSSSSSSSSSPHLLLTLLVPLLQLLPPQAVVAGDSDAHVHRSHHVQRILYDEEDDAPHVHPLLAVVIAVITAVLTLKRRLLREHPVGAESKEDEVHKEHCIKEQLNGTDASRAGIGVSGLAPVVVFPNGCGRRDGPKDKSEAQDYAPTDHVGRDDRATKWTLINPRYSWEDGCSMCTVCSYANQQANKDLGWFPVVCIMQGSLLY